MASRGKTKTTMAKLNRERKLRERRLTSRPKRTPDSTLRRSTRSRPTTC